MTIKQKNNLSIVVFVALTVLITVFVVYPLFTAIKNDSKEAISQKENLLTLEAKIQNLAEFRITYKNREDFFKKIDDLFVNPEVPIKFISFLENTSEEHHLQVAILPPSEKQTEKDLWPYITFQISSSGDFPNFLKFLEKIENSPYLIEVQDLNISRLSESGDTTSNLTIKVFVE